MRLIEDQKGDERAAHKSNVEGASRKTQPGALGILHDQQVTADAQEKRRQSGPDADQIFPVLRGSRDGDDGDGKQHGGDQQAYARNEKFAARACLDQQLVRWFSEATPEGLLF